MNIPPVVSQIVSRCHVGQSNMTVIRYFIARLKHKRKTWVGLPRADRKQWMRLVIAAHSENQALYRHAMSVT